MRMTLVNDMLIPLICFAYVLVCASARDGSVFYLHPSGNLKCAKCKSGTFIKTHCKSNQGESVCEVCPNGTFNKELTAMIECKSCIVCSHTNRKTQNECNTIKDAVCICHDKQYWNNDACLDCTPPKVVTRGIPSDSCDSCTDAFYYNSTLEECTRCKTCDASETVVDKCNKTHNTLCITMVASTIPPEKDNSDKTIIIVVLVVVVAGVVVAGIVVFVCCKKRRRTRNAQNRAPETQTAAELAPLQKVSSNPTNGSTSCDQVSETVNSINRASNSIPPVKEVPLNSPLIQQNDSCEDQGWLKSAIKVLLRDVNSLDELAISLPDIGDFRCYVKWSQSKENDIRTKFNKFMNDWHMTNPVKATLSEIIKVLRELELNDVIENMEQHDILGPLIKRIKLQEEESKILDEVHYADEDQTEPKSPKPIQETGQVKGERIISGEHKNYDKFDMTRYLSSDDEQTFLKKTYS